MTTTGVESADLIDPWLYSTLSGDEELGDLIGERIFATFVPEEVNDPYVMFTLMSLQDVVSHNGDRIMVDAVYLVKAVAQTTSKDDVAPPFARVDALLHRRTVDRPNGHLTCHRESIIDQAEVVEGSVFFHLGGLYRIRGSLIV